MDFSWSPWVLELRQRTHEVLDKHWPQPLRIYAMNDSVSRDLNGAQTTLTGVDDAVIRELWAGLGAADLLRVGVPEEHGGIGGTALERYIVASEVAGSGAPFPYVSMGVVLPSLLYVGDSELMARFLPPILAGLIEFAIGYTEPEAGTDLAALKTSATRVGDHYVVRGQKIFTSGAHYSDYMWAAVRTNPDVPHHAGISLLIIPMDSPGITVTPLETISGTRTNIVFLDDVTVPADLLVGEQDHGWSYITEALAHERFTSLLAAPLVQGYRALVDTLSDAPDHDPVAAATVARLRGRVRMANLLSLRSAVLAAEGADLPADAAMSKLLVSEVRYELARAAVSLLGADGTLAEGAADAPADGQFERMLRHSYVTLFTAGANDIQRNLIARGRLDNRRRSA